MKARDWPMWFALAAALLGSAAFTAGDARADGTRREARAVSAFDGVVLDGPVELFVTQGAAEALAVEAEPRLLPLLRTRVEAGTLHIDLAGSVQTRAPLRVHLTLRTLRRLQADGAGEVRIGALRTPALAIGLGGSSSAQLAALAADRLDLDLTGSSQLQIGSGAVGRLDARIDDAARCDAPGLRSTDARLHLTGSAQARLQATQRLDAAVADSASLRYAGAARLTLQVGDAAELRHEPVQTP